MDTLGDRVREAAKSADDTILFPISAVEIAAIGRRTGVARIFGLNFSGFFAWWLWRTIYLGKLPRFDKKLRVALDWTLDLVFPKDFVQFLTVRAPSVSMDPPMATRGQMEEHLVTTPVEVRR